MSHPRESADGQTALSEEVIGKLAPVLLRHPRGTHALTPASTVFLRAISEHQEQFSGVGIDWGCGSGCLAIVAAKIPAVQRIVGLELSENDVVVATQNANLNSVANKVKIFRADSFEPYSIDGRQELDGLKDGVDFVLANPPASRGDDGFRHRREVLTYAQEYVKSSACVFLQISIQYGWERVYALEDQTGSMKHEMVLASTPWVPFDLRRRDLRRQLDEYVREEENGGLKYTFGDPRSGGQTEINAHAALSFYSETGESPLTKWQVHVFRFGGKGKGERGFATEEMKGIFA